MPVPTLQAQESRDCLYRNTASYDSAVCESRRLDITSTAKKHPVRRWASRKVAMEYAQIGPTTLWTLMRDKRIIAKKLNDKVLIVDSIDALYDSLPDAS
jgi:hypothetical protein